MILDLVERDPAAPGVQLVGPLPNTRAALHSFAVGTSKNSKNRDAEQALTKSLFSAAVVGTLKAEGMPGCTS